MNRMFGVGPTTVRLFAGNCIEEMYGLPAESVDLIFGDPPYFLSGEGTTCKSGKRAKVHKGAWDEPTTPEQQRAFGVQWLAAARRLLKPHGFGSRPAQQLRDAFIAPCEVAVEWDTDVTLGLAFARGDLSLKQVLEEVDR